MIDHLGITASNYDKSKAFYLQALAPLGYTLLMEIPKELTGDQPVAGFGEAPKPDFWVAGAKAGNAPPVHVAFRASSRAQVDAFYAAAMAAGATDNGPPGVRPHYHQNYYGAFVRDPDGHNVEAVCHDPA